MSHAESACPNSEVSPARSQQPPTQAPQPALVVGVGGAGLSLAAEMAQQTLPGVTFAAVHTDAAALQRCPIPWRLQIGAQLTGGLSAGGDPGLGRAAAEQDAAALRDLVRPARLVFIVAGLGGGTGTGAAPVLAELAREAGARALGLVTLPFEWEGAARQAQALEGLEALQAAADGVVCVPHQTLFRLMDPNTPLREAFKPSAALLADALRGLWRALTWPGLIALDFAHLARVLRGSPEDSGFGVAEAQGADRARDLPQRLLASPLLAGGHVLKQAQDVLVSFAGGPDLALREIHFVMDQIRRHAEGAHLMFGATVDEQLADRLAVLLIASAGARTGPPQRMVQRVGVDQVRPAPTAAPSDLDKYLLDPQQGQRPPSRFVPPPPELSEAQKRQLLAQQAAAAGRRRARSRWHQGQLPLEIISRGRFEKSEPTIYRGQDLDVPTYVRRGVPLN